MQKIKTRVLFVHRRVEGGVISLSSLRVRLLWRRRRLPHRRASCWRFFWHRPELWRPCNLQKHRWASCRSPPISNGRSWALKRSKQFEKKTLGGVCFATILIHQFPNFGRSLFQFSKFSKISFQIFCEDFFDYFIRQKAIHIVLPMMTELNFRNHYVRFFQIPSI